MSGASQLQYGLAGLLLVLLTVLAVSGHGNDTVTTILLTLVGTVVGSIYGSARSTAIIERTANGTAQHIVDNVQGIVDSVQTLVDAQRKNGD